MTIAERWSNARNVLCVRLDAMGDVLMTSPAIRAVKERIEGCRITLLGSGSGCSTVPLLDCIDDAVCYEAPWMKSRGNGNFSLVDNTIVQKIKARGFDAAIIFTVYSQNPLPAAMLCYWANIPLRLGHCRENPYSLLTDWIPEVEPQERARHEVQRQLDLVDAIGCRTEDPRIKVKVDRFAHGQMLEVAVEHGLDAKQEWIVMHPGATAQSRRYRPDGFAAAASELIDAGFHIVWTGTEEDSALIRRIQGETRGTSVDLSGKLTLVQLAALIGEASLLISNNTGPVHLAAGLGTPVVDLYALTNPQHTPWHVESEVLFHNVPCRFCYKSVCPEGHNLCLQAIEPHEVVRAAYRLLSKTKIHAAAEVINVHVRH
ncbi:MAG: lipopolysaccharide heptosyltransferase II [Oligoflexales bacterium]